MAQQLARKAVETAVEVVDRRRRTEQCVVAGRTRSTQPGQHPDRERLADPDLKARRSVAVRCRRGSCDGLCVHTLDRRGVRSDCGITGEPRDEATVLELCRQARDGVLRGLERPSERARDRKDRGDVERHDHHDSPCHERVAGAGAQRHDQRVDDERDPGEHTQGQQRDRQLLRRHCDALAAHRGERVDRLPHAVDRWGRSKRLRAHVEHRRLQFLQRCERPGVLGFTARQGPPLVPFRGLEVLDEAVLDPLHVSSRQTLGAVGQLARGRRLGGNERLGLTERRVLRVDEEAGEDGEQAPQRGHVGRGHQAGPLAAVVLVAGVQPAVDAEREEHPDRQGPDEQHRTGERGEPRHGPSS